VPLERQQTLVVPSPTADNTMRMPCACRDQSDGNVYRCSAQIWCVWPGPAGASCLFAVSCPVSKVLLHRRKAAQPRLHRPCGRPSWRDYEVSDNTHQPSKALFSISNQLCRCKLRKLPPCFI
jgi:hypothetical protein